MDNTVNIRIKQALEGNSLPEVKAQLKAVQQEMNATNRTTAEGAARYKELSTNAGLLTNHLKGLTREQKGLSTQTGISNASMLNLGKNISAIGIGIGMAFSKVKQYLGDAISKSMEFEKSLATLKFATDAITFKGLQELNKEFKTTSVFSTKNIIDAEVFLAAQGRTEEQIKKTIKAAMDLSVVTGDDLDGSVRKLDMTYEGSIGRMGRLEGSLKNLTKEQLANGDAITILGEKYQGFAEKQAETLSGKLQILEKNLKGLEKQVGDSLIEELGRKFDVANKSAKDLTNTFDTLKRIIDTVIKVGSDLFTTFNPLMYIFNAIKGIVDGLGFAWKFATDGTYKFKDAINDLWNTLNNAIPLLRLYNALKGGYENLGKGEVTQNITLDDTVKNAVKIKQEQLDRLEESKRNKKDKTPGTSRSGSRGSSKNEPVEVEKTISEQLDKQIGKQNTLLKNLELKGELLTEFLELSLKENNAYDLEKLSLEDQNKLLEQRNKLKGLHWTGLKVSNMGVIKDDNTLVRDYENYQPYEKPKKATTEEVLSGAIDSTNRIKDIFSNMVSGLNIGADTFIGKLVNGFDTVLGIMQTIMAVMEAEKTISSFLGLLIPGKASGGLLVGPGTGTSDSILARVSNGEYIVNANATSQYLPFLNAINGGNSNLSNMFQSYASGGYIRGDSNIKVNMPDIKLDGSDIYLSWRRHQRTENLRKS